MPCDKPPQHRGLRRCANIGATIGHKPYARCQLDLAHLGGRVGRHKTLLTDSHVEHAQLLAVDLSAAATAAARCSDCCLPIESVPNRFRGTPREEGRT